MEIECDWVLQNVFPNVQFIVATYSLILFALNRDVWLIDVDRDKIWYEYSNYEKRLYERKK